MEYGVQLAEKCKKALAAVLRFTLSSTYSLIRCRRKLFTQTTRSHVVNSYFLIADVLGFSSIVTNLKNDELNARIHAWIGLAEETKSKTGVNDMQLISDTLFVREDDSNDGLGRLLRFAQLLLEGGIERSFPIRGAITHGCVTWGKLTYGKPVIDAHRLEEALDWIGIACSPNLPHIESFWSWDLVCVYPVPKKNGYIQLLPVVVWSIPEPDTLVTKSGGPGMYKGRRSYSVGTSFQGRAYCPLCEISPPCHSSQIAP